MCVCLPQITRITQRRNTAELHYFAEKYSLMFVLFLEFLCDYLGDPRETHGVLFGDWLSKLACLSPADYADYADEYSKLYYFAEKDRLMFVLFGGCLGVVCVICEISGRLIGVSFVQYILSTLM